VAREEVERQWITRIRAGDAAAFEAMFKAYYPRLYRLAQSYVHDAEAAADLVQDVLLRVWEQRDRWEVTGSVASYLFGSARNRSIDYLRRRLVERRWRDKAAGPGAPPLPIAPRAERADVAVELSDLDRAIMGTIDRLPARCRQVFVLCREHGLTYAETAEVMGISPKTVQIQMGRALKILRGAVGPFLTVVLALTR
jgi:RNA polymerase sigma-70 factor (ECF subfamily)